ncbi:hypothetical protein HHI36_003462 [Cryptolaemus montrouzieri]|uniref:Adenylate cyclase n=1 Tax=Cryptolaemus montrouzieri TaxID=559131 RepID=A0ABD2PDR2_9CUCU
MSLEKICRVNLHFNESICDALVLRNRSGYLPHHEVEVQQLVVKWAAYKAFLVGSIPVVCIIFLGSWSDRHRRRKPIILIPLFGDLIGSIGLLVCSYFFLELSIEYSWMVDTLTASLFGGQCSINLGIFSYVAGISSDEDRTLRIGSVSIATTLAISTGMFMSGFVLNLLGFVGAYSLSVSLLILAITSGMIMIKEETVKETKEDQKGYLRDFFSLEYVKNTFKICFQKKDPNKRTKMFVIMFLCTMIVGPMQGEITLNYMYLRLKCGWDEVDFSIFNAFHFVSKYSGIYSRCHFSRNI